MSDTTHEFTLFRTAICGSAPNFSELTTWANHFIALGTAKYGVNVSESPITDTMFSKKNRI